MPTDTVRDDRHTLARDFALRGVAWSLGLFGLIRLSWFEVHAVLPLTGFQARLATAGFGAPVLPINVTLACSGADALALCAGFILAYPATWRMRLGGAAGGIGLILALNTARIGTLGRAAASPSSFAALHVYVWPALLMLAIAGYVFAWMRFADRRRAAVPASESQPEAGRFLFLTGAFLVLFIAASPLYLESAGVLAIAGFVARAAAALLRLFGLDATAAANVLSTSRGGFGVTQECLATPLIPVYFAAVVAYSRAWPTRALALVAALPLFVALGIARLLVIALPVALVPAPIFAIHAFYQLLLALVVVCLAAVWRHGTGATAWRRATLGAALGVGFMYLLGFQYTSALSTAFAAGTPLADPQGAIAFLPAFQIGLYLALSVAVFRVFAWQRAGMGLAVLGLSHLAVFATLQFLARHGELTPHVRDVRIWALAVPLLLIATLARYDSPHR